MNKKGVIFLLVFLLICWIAWISYTYALKTEPDRPNKTEIVESKNKPKPVFSLSDNKSFFITNKNNIRFSLDNEKMVVPDELSSDFAKLSEFLNNNPEKTLVISGLFTKGGKPKPTLAEERAQKFKEFLMNNFGVDTGKIMVNSQITESVLIENNFAFGALNYLIDTKEIDTTTEIENTDSESVIKGNDGAIVISNNSDFESKMDSEILALSKKRQIYYYPPTFDYISISRDLEKYLEAMEIYFSYNQEGLMEIKGYNDSEGGVSEIREEGLKKAKLMKNYILDNYNISAENITVRSSSRQIPQDDNVARAQNRKIVFKIIP